jgi:hypothetical protein
VINLDALKQLDLAGLAPANIDLTRLDLRSIDLPTFDLPKFDLPKFDLPTFDLPTVDLPDADRVVAIARDAAYIGIGAAVVAARAAEDRRRAVTDQVTTQFRKVVDAVA